MKRDPLDILVADAAELLEADLQRERRGLAPDFAALIEEAHARDPWRVPASALAEARELAPVVGLRSDANMKLGPREQEEFAGLLAAARAEIEVDVAAVRAAGPPAVPVPQVRSAGSRWWPWLAAAAAIAALAFGLRPLLGRGETAEAGIQAPWQDQGSPPRYEATPAPPPAPVVRRGAREEPAAPEVVEPEVVEPEVVEPEVVEPAKASEDTGLKEQAQKVRPRVVKEESLAEKLRRLDGEAEALWHSGDLAGAEARYREIIRLGPGGRAADLAYGDLFSLTRQRHGPAQEVVLWREYLQTFPRGRYADDARAGLCRRAEGEERGACWSAYLADFPAGLHRHQAARVLGEGDE